MQTATRFIIAILIFLASYFFIYWVPFSWIPGMSENRLIPQIISLVLALAIAIYSWKKIGNLSKSLATSILLGGLMLGAIGFIAGFVGPIIFYPESNQGPLLGIFITGPLGFLFGMIIGALYWMINRRKNVPS